MTTYTTYADLYRPQTRSRSLVYNILLVIGGSLLVAASAQVAIPVPFSPVPITGQTFGVLLVAALLGSRRGALAMVAYIAEGTMGLPVFAAGKAGLMHLAGPTGGYLVGFVAAAWVVGYLSEIGFDRKVWTTLVAMTVGNAVLFLFGVLWLGMYVGMERALPLGLYPFLIGSVIKTGLAAALLPLGWKLIGKGK